MTEEKFENQESSTQEETSQTEVSVQEPQADDLAKTKEQLLRLAAEFENYKRRTSKEIEEAHKFAMSKFARDLIDVLENLHRAESSFSTEVLESNESFKAIFSGIELTKKSLIDVFEKYGIKRIDPIGEQFNHDFHQAIMQVPSKTHQNGEVVQVIQAGYVMNDRLLRPALVAVAKSEE